MRVLRSFVLSSAAVVLLAGATFAQAPKSGSAGEPTSDVKRSGVAKEKSAERPADEMNPHPNYSNTEKNVDNAPVYAPGIDQVPRDSAPGPQKSGETATTPVPARK